MSPRNRLIVTLTTLQVYRQVWNIGCDADTDAGTILGIVLTGAIILAKLSSAADWGRMAARCNIYRSKTRGPARGT